MNATADRPAPHATPARSTGIAGTRWVNLTDGAITLETRAGHRMTIPPSGAVATASPSRTVEAGSIAGVAVSELRPPVVSNLPPELKPGTVYLVTRDVLEAIWTPRPDVYWACPRNSVTNVAPLLVGTRR